MKAVELVPASASTTSVPIRSNTGGASRIDVERRRARRRAGYQDVGQPGLVVGVEQQPAAGRAAIGAEHVQRVANRAVAHVDPAGGGVDERFEPVEHRRAVERGDEAGIGEDVAAGAEQAGADRVERAGIVDPVGIVGEVDLAADVPPAIVLTVAAPPLAWISKPLVAWTRPRTVIVLVVAEVTAIASEVAPVVPTLFASTVTKPMVLDGDDAARVGAAGGDAAGADDLDVAAGGEGVDAGRAGAAGGDAAAGDADAAVRPEHRGAAGGDRRRRRRARRFRSRRCRSSRRRW